jgi:hypothetical protein
MMLTRIGTLFTRSRRASACLSLNNIISVKEGTDVIIVIWQERREEISLIHILRHDSSALKVIGYNSSFHI